MTKQKLYKRIFARLLKFLLSVPRKKDWTLKTPDKILVVRQHNQFGDLLASVPLFRALKETYPDAKLNVLVSPQNYYAVTKNRYIDHFFIFSKKKLFNPFYFRRLWLFLRDNYDLAIMAPTVSISSTSCILTRLSDAQNRIGPESLNGMRNHLSYLFNFRVNMDWRKYPDAHVSDFALDIVRPFGIKTSNYQSSISFDDIDLSVASGFIGDMKPKDDELIVGIHIGAGKPPNRWPVGNFIEVIQRLRKEHKLKLYVTGSSSDENEIKYFRNNIDFDASYFINREIPQLTALISLSDLFITNDTGVMHVAGTTKTPQISIFGPTNPFNWAPVGPNKYFVRKSDIISEITVDEVYNLAILLINTQPEHQKNDT